MKKPGSKIRPKSPQQFKGVTSAFKDIDRSLVMSLKDIVAILSPTGQILMVNSSWVRFAKENAAENLQTAGEGVNYFTVCQKSADSGDDIAQTALDGICAVSEGSRLLFEMEYPCNSPTEKRWFHMIVIPYKGMNGVVIVIHTDITPFKDVEQQLLKSNTELKLHLTFEKLISELSAKFINLPVDRISFEIENGLKEIRNLFELDRCGFFSIYPQKNESYLIAMATAEGVDPAPMGVNLAPLFPWITSKVFAGELLGIKNSDLPLEAAEDKKNSEELIKFRYSLTIPLFVDGSVRYCIGMTTNRQEHTLSDDFNPRLKMLGEIIASAHNRNQSAESLSRSEAKYRTVADFNYDWEYWEEPDGALCYVSPSCERISGYTPEEFIKNKDLINDIIFPEDLDNWEQHHRHAHIAKVGGMQQFRIKTREQETRWIEHACRPIWDDTGTYHGIRGSNRDITIRKQAELELRNAYSEIEQLKDQLQEEKTYLQEEIKLSHNFENIIGQSSVLKYVLYKVNQVAPTESAVLIQGETGVGKELIARAIHSNSLRNNSSLIKINCAALPAGLIESELFGHEKGAFTSANMRMVGRFELANRGTLFLDEIGEAPLEIQSKLLRVIEHGEFERLGSTKTLKTDVRIITATNRNLEEDVKNGRFRQDLFYRLNVFPISVPPLRERQDDIPLLVDWFINKHSRKHGKEVRSVPIDLMASLQEYSWPGNIRELENIIERAIISLQGNRLQLADSIKRPAGELQNLENGMTLEQVEREYIIKILKQTRWRVGGLKGAALILGLNPSTLRSRMQKLNIIKPL